MAVEKLWDENSRRCHTGKPGVMLFRQLIMLLPCLESIYNNCYNNIFVLTNIA